MDRGRYLTQTSFIAVAVALCVAPAFAQEDNGGVLSLATGLNVDTNRDLDTVSPGTSTKLYERLTYSFIAATNSQVFEFSLGAQLEYEEIQGVGTDFGIEEPALKFLYSKSSANSEFSIDGDYWQGDISTAFDVDPTDPGLIGVDDGTLLRTNTNIAFETGLNSALGFFGSAGYQTRDYSKTSNRENDTSTFIYDVGAVFRFSKTTEGTLSFGQEKFKEDNAASRKVDTSDLTFGISHELGNALTLTGQFGYEDRTTKAAGISVTESGYFVGAGFSQERPNGLFFGGVDYNGTRFRDEYSVNVGRSLELPDGSLSANITLTNIEVDGLQVTGYIDYIRRMATGELAISLSNEQRTDSSDRDILFSKLAVGYEQEINSFSSFEVSLDLSRTQNKYFSAAFPIEDRATFTASYSRAVTPEWDLNVGYSHREYTATNTTTNANSDSVFLTLTRDIQFGF